MYSYNKLIQEHFCQDVKFNIHSNPSFLFETLLAIAVCLVHAFLYTETSNMLRKSLKLKPNMVYCGSVSDDTLSKTSTCTSITRYREFCHVQNYPFISAVQRKIKQNFCANSEIGMLMPSSSNDQEERKQYVERMINLTPEQYVQIDKDRRKRDNEVKQYMSSLSTLCKNVLRKKYSATTLKDQIEAVKENIACNRISVEGKYLGFKTTAMTASLFNILESLILGSSVENPIPFKGDITTFAVDAAELTMTNDNLATKRTKKWEAESSTKNILVKSDTVNVNFPSEEA